MYPGLDSRTRQSKESVYGKPEYLPYDESHPTTPVSPYRASKLAAERYGCAYSEVSDLSVVPLRYFTVRVNVRLLSEDGADGEAVNIGSTDNIDVLTLAEEIRDQCVPALDIEFAGRHAADAEHTHADTAKARELLGYEPTDSIREGVEAFVEWYRANRAWYEPLVRSS